MGGNGVTSRRPYWLLVLAGLLLAGGILMQSYGGRVKLRNDAVRGCERAQKDRRGLLTLNADMSRFAADASEARRKDGNVDTAVRYAVISIRAGQRSVELADRLPPRLECSRAYPHPSPFPWAG
jgi:hypothetical protein